MLTKQYRDILDGIKTTQYGRALQEFLEDEKSKLNNVKTLESWDEALGRKYAVEIIDKMFAFVLEKKADDTSRNQYN